MIYYNFYMLNMIQEGSLISANDRAVHNTTFPSIALHLSEKVG